MRLSELHLKIEDDIQDVLATIADLVKLEVLAANKIVTLTGRPYLEAKGKILNQEATLVVKLESLSESYKKKDVLHDIPDGWQLALTMPTEQMISQVRVSSQYVLAAEQAAELWGSVLKVMPVPPKNLVVLQDCTKETERLDWLLNTKNLRVYGNPTTGWSIQDPSKEETYVVVSGATSAREAIDLAIKLEADVLGIEGIEDGLPF